MDDVAALEMAREFQSLLDEAHRKFNASTTKAAGLAESLARMSAQVSYTALEAKLKESLYAIEGIAREVDPALVEGLRTPVVGGWRYLVCQTTCDELVGRLDARIKLGPILATRGPLEAARLHSWVWKAAERLWVTGHYAEAVRAAASRILDHELPEKLGVPHGSSTSMGEAFSDKPPTASSPRLRFYEFAVGTEDWHNAHEGAKFFGMGCEKAIRNLVTHGARRPEEEDALEMLAALTSAFRGFTPSELGGSTKVAIL